MTKMDYLKLLVDEIHSTTVATIGSDGHPQTRIIDMMYYDEEGVYFLTAKGKAFYDQLMEQQYVAISATKDKIRKTQSKCFGCMRHRESILISAIHQIL